MTFTPPNINRDLYDLHTYGSPDDLKVVLTKRGVIKVADAINVDIADDYDERFDGSFQLESAVKNACEELAKALTYGRPLDVDLDGFYYFGDPVRVRFNRHDYIVDCKEKGEK